MKRLIVFLACLSVGAGLLLSRLGERVGFTTPNSNPVAAYEGEPDEDLLGVMVPIPMGDRVFNRTGIQCVWCSLETVGRYAGEPKLVGLTDQSDCKGYSNPTNVSRKLKQLGVKFEQTTSKRDRSLIVRSVVVEKRGCLFAIPGHAMTLVHYDERAGIVKYINNSDRTLQVRTWTMSEFDRRWDGWICVVYPDKERDRIVDRPGMRIVDRNGPQGTYPDGYVTSPGR